MATFIEQYYWVIIIAVLAIIGLCAVTIWAIRQCRKKSRYEYSALEEEALLQDRLEMDRKQQKDANRGLAMINCQYYLRGSSRYILVSQLNDIGSRIDRHWFKVRDAATKTERLMAMTPFTIKNCPFKINTNSQKVLQELFLTLQHPYVYPLLDFDFKTLSDQQFAITVTPFSDKGSLKDLIYHSNCLDDWTEKYRYHGEGLPITQLQRLGRQILEGLLFLQEKGYPPFGHLHTGNVIIQNGVARVTGLDHPLLGHSPKILTLAQKRLREHPEAVDAVCFGHLLFEMARGYELTKAHPSEKHYSDLAHLPQIIKVLKFIFEQENSRYPTIQEISCLDFFRHIDLRELRTHSSMPVFQSKLTPAAKSLLKDIRKHSKYKRTPSKRSQSTSAIETASLSSQDSSESRASRSKLRGHSGSQTTGALSELCALPTSPFQDSSSGIMSPSFYETPHQSYSKGLSPQRRTYEPSNKPAGSSQTVASLSNTSGSTEYYTPPDTPQPIVRRTAHYDNEAESQPPLLPRQISQREQLLDEIKASWRRKRLVDLDSPDA